MAGKNEAAIWDESHGRTGEAAAHDAKRQERPRCSMVERLMPFTTACLSLRPGPG